MRLFLLPEKDTTGKEIRDDSEFLLKKEMFLIVKLVEIYYSIV